MGTPEIPGTVAIAEGLDDTRRQAAARNTSEALEQIRLMEQEARARRLAKTADLAGRIDMLHTV